MSAIAIIELEACGLLHSLQLLIGEECAVHVEVDNVIVADAVLRGVGGQVVL